MTTRSRDGYGGSLTCPRCGTENPLGRVFCGSCGGKLDLAAVDRALATAERPKRRTTGRGVPAALAVVLLVLIAVGLALWPQTQPLGRAGTSRGGRRVETQLSAFQRLRPGQRLVTTFLEEDLNGFFAFKAIPLDVQALSISLGENRFTVRVVQASHPLQIPRSTRKLALPFSLDLTCVSRNGKAAPSRAMIGHLPLLGPTRIPVAMAVKAIARRDRNWAIAASVAGVQVEAGKLSVTVAK